MGLTVRPMEGLASRRSDRLLSGFRERLRKTSWSHKGRSALFEPVWSSACDVERLEALLLALYRAHLKVLALASEDPAPGGPEGDLARLLRRLRSYYVDWPSIGDLDGPLPVGGAGPDAARFLYGRPDIVMGVRGPQVVETNFDTAVSGYEKPDDVWVFSAELFEAGAHYVTRGRPLEELKRYFAEFAQGEERWVHWVMKGSAEARAQYDPIIRFLDRNEDGVRHRIHYAGDPVASLAREPPAYLHRACTIYTVNRERPRFAAMLERLSGVARGCTVPVGLSVLMSKLFLAWLSDPRSRPSTLSAEEVTAVTALVPWTRLLGQLDGADLERVRRDRGDFVVKKTDSHLGLDVFFGCAMTADAWSALLDEKQGRSLGEGGAPDLWLVQERVRPMEIRLVEHTEAGALERATGLSCCPYILGGRIRAMETWTTPFTPSREMLHAMDFVGHFIR